MKQRGFRGRDGGSGLCGGSGPRDQGRADSTGSQGRVCSDQVEPEEQETSKTEQKTTMVEQTELRTTRVEQKTTMAAQVEQKSPKVGLKNSPMAVLKTMLEPGTMTVLSVPDTTAKLKQSKERLLTASMAVTDRIDSP